MDGNGTPRRLVIGGMGGSDVEVNYGALLDARSRWGTGQPLTTTEKPKDLVSADQGPSDATIAGATVGTFVTIVGLIAAVIKCLERTVEGLLCLRRSWGQVAVLVGWFAALCRRRDHRDQDPEAPAQQPQQRVLALQRHQPALEQQELDW